MITFIECMYIFRAHGRSQCSFTRYVSNRGIALRMNEPYLIFGLTNLRNNEPSDYCIKCSDKQTLFHFRTNEHSGIGNLCVRTNEPSD